MAREVAAAIVFLGMLTACGSAGPRGFHSAAKIYSVHEVEVAFSQRGLPLVEAQSQRLPGVTALVHGRGSRSVSIQVAPHDATLYALIREKGPRPPSGPERERIRLLPGCGLRRRAGRARRASLVDLRRPSFWPLSGAIPEHSPRPRIRFFLATKGSLAK